MLEMKINNIFSSYSIDVFPGFKNMPNLININFYDIFFQKISDGFEVEIKINGFSLNTKTKDGKVSFIFEEKAEFYEIEIKVLNNKFKEIIELKQYKKQA